ncbi:MAG: isochorismatase family protein [Geminicoccaceae bacterium]|nr:isochorismatase family protein [Geminicoccaceae bacterium]
MRLDAARSLLMVVDVQARLAPAIPGITALVDRAGLVLAAAERLGVPVLVTEQYPKGLGATAPELALPKGATVLPKIAFSAVDDPSIKAFLRRADRDQIVLLGTETHVCVLQTGLGLLAEGYAVFVVADAVGSRGEDSKRLALDRLKGAGAVVVSAEMVAFEWLREADTDDFRALIGRIKQT